MTKKIMFQGTASNVGKSIIAAGFCRLFTRKGYKVVPFKSQNMSLNSFVDKDGKEMGRAQVFQAEACNIEPFADMNPILLKPGANHKSQIIVRGKVVKELNGSDYYKYKLELIPMLKNVFESIQKDKNIVVLEGAGSCAELNLMDRDISNMIMADIANTPVILVADIDRGGVFASVVGTLNLLPKKHRDRVCGVIINKFRGNKKTFEDAVCMLENIIKIPVLGVIPWFDLKIEEEDGVTKKFDKKIANKNKKHINIEVIKTPHLSNTTDFAIFDFIKDVNVTFIKKGESLTNPDIIILGGSKNTIDDMDYLRKSGLEKQIKDAHKKGTIIIGICGGYQMLGEKIIDKNGSDGLIGEVSGLGFLDFYTEFKQNKKTNQISTKVKTQRGYLKGLSNMYIEGYEIHMGKTLVNKNSNNEKFTSVGTINLQGDVFGTYVHGIFDNTDFCTQFINNIREKKGMAKIKNENKTYKQLKDNEYNKLADIIEQNIDMDKIYQSMGL